MSRPWMPLYVADYLADTAHLNAAQSGAYLHLIMHYWQRGGLPDDDAMLARIAKMTPDEFSNARALLQQFFSNAWKHERIEHELAESKAAYERRSVAGSKGGRAKSAKFSSNAKAMPQQCSTNAVATTTTISSSLRSEDIRASEKAAFERFWSVWPNRVGKPAAEKAFRKVSKEIDAIVEGVERYVADTRASGRQWLNPATFLNQRRWEDAPAPSPTARPPPRDNRNGVGNLLAEAYGLNGHGNQENHSQAIRSLPLLGDGEREPDRGDDGGLPGDASGLLAASGFSRM